MTEGEREAGTGDEWMDEWILAPRVVLTLSFFKKLNEPFSRDAACLTPMAVYVNHDLNSRASPVKKTLQTRRQAG